MKTHNDKTEICKEVLEMKERRLPWILRQGITFIFIMVTGGLIISCFIKYSEKVPVDFTLTDKNGKLTGEAIVPLEISHRLARDMPVIIELPVFYRETQSVDTCLLSTIHYLDDSCMLTITHPYDANKGTKNILPLLIDSKVKGEIIVSEKYLIVYFTDQLSFK